MMLQYTNRTGKTYYLRKGKTKTGKPRYFVSATQDGKGEAVEHIPEGFEIYEHPENAQVFLRKKRPILITDIEKQLVEKHAKKLRGSRRYRVDCKDEYITIYESDTDFDELKDTFAHFMKRIPLRSGMDADEAMNFLAGISDQHYTPMIRFRMVGKERRKFVAERFSFRGAVDEWDHLRGPDDLKSLVEKYLKLRENGKLIDLPHY